MQNDLTGPHYMTKRTKQPTLHAKKPIFTCKTTKQHPHIMPQMNKDHTHLHSGGYLLASGSYTTIAALYSSEHQSQNTEVMWRPFKAMHKPEKVQQIFM
jgi:hypothetical protein